jgi:hypothetical protein
LALAYHQQLLLPPRQLKQQLGLKDMVGYRALDWAVPAWAMMQQQQQQQQQEEQALEQSLCRGQCTLLLQLGQLGQALIHPWI